MTTARLHHSAGIVLPSSPDINLSGIYKKFARYPGLRYLFDPLYLSDNGAGYDLKSHVPLIPAHSPHNNQRIASDADFNGKAVLRTLSHSGGVRIEGPMNPSFTIMGVLAIDADARENGNLNNIWTSWNPVGPETGMGVQMPNGQFRGRGDWRETFYATVTKDDVNGNTPLAGQVALMTFSFDAATFQTALTYRKTQLQVTQMTRAMDAERAALQRMHVGASNSNPSSTTGFKGRVGMCAVFDDALHLQQNQGLYEDAAGQFHEFYAIAA